MEILDHIEEHDASSDTQTLTHSEQEDCEQSETQAHHCSCCAGENSGNARIASSAEPRRLIPSGIKIDVSEVKDGISSVQITVPELNNSPAGSGSPGGNSSGGNSPPGNNNNSSNKIDQKKMKEFLLTSYSVEAS